MTKLVALVVLFAGTIAAAAFAADPALPKFEAQTIDDHVEIGYGLAVGDVDGDGKPDVLLADKKQYVWYQNPTWKKYILVENLTPLDNVCIAARDIDGDGKVEIAVGAQWNPGDTVNSGSVHYLLPPEDRTQKWTPIELHHEPTVHRMRWVKLADKQFVLVVSPLHGRGNRNGEGEGVRLLAYTMPKNPRDPWTTTLLDDQLHMTHNLDPVQWNPETPAEEILSVGREGLRIISFGDGRWSSKAIDRVEGSGEVRFGASKSGVPFIATIEPMHGTKLVCYPVNRAAMASDGPVTGRIVLDESYQGGHAVAVADFLGNGTQQIAAGWRVPNADKKVGVKLYYSADTTSTKWESNWIDENGMATEDLHAADLDADSRPEIIAAGRDTHNLKIYWNR